ncbi:MAG: LPS assembly protein LptD [Pseudomonadota bacterium]
MVYLRQTLLFTILVAATPVWAGDKSLACTAQRFAPPTYTQDGVIVINADASQAEIDAQQVHFSGDVELLQDRRRITADEIVYNQVSQTADASGTVTFSQPGLVLRGTAAHVELAADRGHVENPSFQLPEIGGRGKAERGELEGRNQLRATEIQFTTCRPGNTDWLLTARSLEVDRIEGKATARGARLKFKGVPVLASPWLKFRLDDQRESGFLAPTAGYSSRNGFEYAQPYYLNLAPNYDATLYPRIISKRGLMLGGEFRYLFPGHEGEIFGEIIPDDRDFVGDDATRGAFRMRHTSYFSQRLRANLTLNAVSDDEYLEDFGSNLAASSTRYLDNIGELNYYRDHWRFLARIHNRDVLGKFDQPLTRSPQFYFSLRQPVRDFAKLHLDAEYVYFDRDPGVTGQRVDLFPAVSFAWRKPYAYVEPLLGARYTTYSLNDNAPGDSNEPDRSLLTASLDAGLFFDSEARWINTSGTQTLEPRLFYLYTPFEDQTDLPVFDSTIPDLSFPNLFRINRFTGADRVSDANQLTLAVTSRFIEHSSLRERVRASFGQIYYFEDRQVQLPGFEEQTASASPFVGELEITLDDRWATTAFVQWDPDESRFENSLLRVRYEDVMAEELANLAYRYDPLHDQEYSDLSVRWPLSSHLKMVGRWQYSLEERDTMEALAGLEYDSCCWRVRGAVRRYLVNTDTYENAFFLQLELKGLGRLGHDIDALLRRNVYRYDSL